MKSSSRHARYSCRQCNESPNHWQQPSEEDSQITPSGKELLCPIQFALAHQNPAAVTFDQWTSTVAADLIRYERPQVATERPRRRHPKQIELTLENQIAGKRHNQFRRKRNASRLDRHQQKHAGVPGRSDYGIDEYKNDGKKFFSHERKQLQLRVAS